MLLRAVAAKRRQFLMEEWAEGTFMHEQSFATAISNARSQGECRALSLLTELDFDSTMSEVFDDYERKRATPEGESSADPSV